MSVAAKPERGRACQEVVFGNPLTLIAEPLDVSGQIERVPKRLSD
jgi:hypothetical protein